MQQWIDHKIRIIIQDDRQMIGQFLAFDKHMNIVLADTEELRYVSTKGKQKEEKMLQRSLGLVIIRGEIIVSMSVEGPPPSEEAKAKASIIGIGPGIGRAAGRGLAMPPGLPGRLGPPPGLGVPGAPGMMMRGPGPFPPPGFRGPLPGGPPGVRGPPSGPGGPSNVPQGGPPPGPGGVPPANQRGPSGPPGSVPPGFRTPFRGNMPGGPGNMPPGSMPPGGMPNQPSNQMPNLQGQVPQGFRGQVPPGNAQPGQMPPGYGQRPGPPFRG